MWPLDLLNEEVRRVSGARSDTETEDEAMAVNQHRRTTGARQNSEIIEKAIQIELPGEVILVEDERKKDAPAAAVFSDSDDDEDLSFLKDKAEITGARVFFFFFSFSFFFFKKKIFCVALAGCFGLSMGAPIRAHHMIMSAFKIT